jgi:hypothetical protein
MHMIYSKAVDETIPTDGPYHDLIKGMDSSGSTKLRMIFIFWWGWTKTVAGSYGGVLVGKWIVWDPPKYHWKALSTAFFWCNTNMVVPV